MTHLRFVLYLTCLFSWKRAHMYNMTQQASVKQEGGFISANAGDNVTLRCFYAADATRYYWYKHKLGEKLQLMSITYKYDKTRTFHNEFKDNPRFLLDTDSEKNHLKITDLKLSDSATYYCAKGNSFIYEFGEGVTVSVRGADGTVPAVVHQSVSGSIQPRGSVTLNCTVQTGTCDGRHSVYWFRDSGEAHPGIIYTHGDRNDQCERKPDTQTHTCVYNLPLRNLNGSDAGTYYCAVASCGRILFGNGTKLDFVPHMYNVTQPTSVKQEGGFVSANAGDNLTLRCFYAGDATRYYWYKQNLGEKPQLMSITYKYDETRTFYNEFKDNPRFSMDTDSDRNQLTIKDLKLSDSATYYCANGSSYIYEFGEGVTVSVRGADGIVPAVVHQPVSGSIQPRGSVTLNCTVQTGTCDGRHSVYWFRDSGEAHPGIIYTHGDRNDQCERKPDTQTHTCVYNLLLRNLNGSDAGTYYCAVASCGRILFGNGTKLDFGGQKDSSFLVYVLSGAVTFTTILCMLLIFLMCKMRKTNCKRPAPSTTNAEGNTDDLHYVALSINYTNRSRKQRNEALSECVYSGVNL